MIKSTNKQYNLYDMGFDKYMSKTSSILGFVENADQTSQLASIMSSDYANATPLSNLDSGELASNISMTAGFLQSSDYVANVSGWRLSALGIEANNGYFRGDITGATGTFSGTVNVGSLNIPNTTTANSAHTDTTGNSWWGCNVSDFNADNNNAKAYILNTGLAKFQDVVLGSDSKYFKYDGSNADALSIRIIENFVNGEDLDAGDVVCMKPRIDTLTPSADSWTSSTDGDSNYGSDSKIIFYSAGGLYPFFKFDLSDYASPDNIIKAEIVIPINDTVPASTVHLQLCTLSASWAENTITYNNQPTLVNNLPSGYGGASSTILTTDTSVTIDVTLYIRSIIAGDVSNYGFSATADVQFRCKSKEGGSPITLVLYTTSNGDGKAYKADKRYYILSRNIVGIAMDTKNIGETSRIQKSGLCNGFLSLDTGGSVFLDEAGDHNQSTYNTTRIISIGKAKSSTEVDICIQDLDIAIEKYTISTTSSTVKKIYLPQDCRYISYSLTDGNSNSYYGILRKETIGITSHTLPSGYVIAVYTNYIQINTPISGSTNTTIVAYK